MLIFYDIGLGKNGLVKMVYNLIGSSKLVPKTKIIFEVLYAKNMV